MSTDGLEPSPELTHSLGSLRTWPALGSRVALNYDGVAVEDGIGIKMQMRAMPWSDKPEELLLGATPSYALDAALALRRGTAEATKRAYLADYVGEGSRVQDLHLDGYDLLGPGLVLIEDSTTVESCTVSVPLEETLASASYTLQKGALSAVGAILVANSSFVNCQFHGVGFLYRSGSTVPHPGLTAEDR